MTLNTLPRVRREQPECPRNHPAEPLQDFSHPGRKERKRSGCIGDSDTIHDAAQCPP